MKKQILKTIYVVTFMAAFVLFGAVSLFYKNDTIGNEEKVTLGGVGYKDMAGILMIISANLSDSGTSLLI